MDSKKTLYHPEFIKKHDNPTDIRFISNQVLTEYNAKGKPKKNWKAGQQITKFIRDEGFLAPILICTTKIERTRYVTEYKMVGSTGKDLQLIYRYFDALAARRKNDTEWAKYGGDAEPFYVKSLEGNFYRVP